VGVGVNIDNHCDWKPGKRLVQLIEDSKLILEKGKKRNTPSATLEKKRIFSERQVARSGCLFSFHQWNEYKVDEFFLKQTAECARLSTVGFMSEAKKSRKSTSLL
jgi:hypothetical protein